ncbi:uncharacterized protein QC761_117490 [Podospora bellae-mahoneyi]|uniref:Uncharacterized protein n=1 Tax=Podospora bellae-mahoneyi TaxID=2093777 RepID=A0ABR0G0N2_9PEZI|nr:hypothetical protein QC761_117490 [Podospora bellae-mahoneyi]
MSRILKAPFKALRTRSPPSSDTQSQEPDENLHNTKPLVLRTPFLIAIGLYIIGLIVALEYGFRTITIAENRLPVLNKYGYEDGTGAYGPFLAPRLYKARAEEDSSQLSTTTGFSSTGTPSATSTAPPVFTSFPQNTSSSVFTPEPILISTSTSTSTSTATLGWDALPTEAMEFGERIGYPVINVPTNGTLSPNRTSPYGIQRRVPPKDKYGQIAGYRIRLSFWHVAYWKSSPPGDIPYVRTPVKFISSINFFPLDKATESDCTIICDGPAFVFLEPSCWSEWSRVATAQRDMRALNPSIMVEYNEFASDGARPCAKVAPDIVETRPVTATLFNPLPSVTTTELIYEDVVVTGPGQGSYVPSTYTLSDIDGKPTTTVTTPVWVPAETPVYTTTVMTLTDSNGRPTATITGHGRSSANQPRTLFDDKGKPTATVIVNGGRWVWRTRTMTGGHGTTPIATITAFATLKFATVTGYDDNGVLTTATGKFPLVPKTITMRDSNGVPTATVTTQVPTTYNWGVTITDSSGRPVATVWSKDDAGIFRAWDDDRDGNPATLDTVSWGTYLLASFLPIIITLPLTILAQIIDSHVKALLPLKAMSRRSDGSSAEDSLFLTTGGIKGFFTSWRLLFHSREPGLLLSQMLILVSSATASFATEAIGFKLHGGCTIDSFAGCFMEIAIFRAPGRLVQVFLSLSLAVVVFLIFAMWNWHRNCGSDMRSIAGVAALLTEQTTRETIHKAKVNITDKYVEREKMIKELSDHKFALRQVAQAPLLPPSPRHSPTATSTSSETSLGLSSSQSSSQKKYGPYCTVMHLTNRSNTNRPHLALVTLPNEGQKQPSASKKTSDKKLFSLNPVAQDYIAQVVFLLTIIAFLIMILYYELTSFHDSAFEIFMNSQNLGVRALFAGLGFIISLFWDSYFFNIATREPYRLLSRQPRLLQTDGTRRSNRFFTTPPPLHVFEALTPSSVFYSLQDRSFVVPAVAAVTVLSKLTPPLLSNIPFVPWLTWETHQACAWSVVGTLVLMILVLGWNLVAVRYPYMPVNPGGDGMGLVGWVYYLCDSNVRAELGEVYSRRQEVENGGGVWRWWKGRGQGGEKTEGSEGERGRYVTFGEVTEAETGGVRVGIGEYGVGRG